MDKVQRDLRLLKAYALLSAILFPISILWVAKGPSKRINFEEINAERINIIEKDGKVRLTLSNRERMPGGQMSGVELRSREGNRTMGNGAPGAGLLFFNDEGDECGGLLYSSGMVNGKPTA